MKKGDPLIFFNIFVIDCSSDVTACAECSLAKLQCLLDASGLTRSGLSDMKKKLREMNATLEEVRRQGPSTIGWSRKMHDWKRSSGSD